MPSPAGGRKVVTPPSPKHRHYGHRFRKQLDPNFIVVAVPGGSGFLSAGFAGFLSASFTDFSEPALTIDSLGVASLAAASVPSRNLVRNCIEFCNLG